MLWRAEVFLLCQRINTCTLDLPPKCSCLEAAVTYCDSRTLAGGINSFAVSKSVTVRIIFTTRHLERDLAHSWSYFTVFAESVSAAESLGTTPTIRRSRTDPPPSSKNLLLIEPFLSDKIRGSLVLKELPKVLSVKHCDIPDGIRSWSIPKYKHTPPASVDVERYFVARNYWLREGTVQAAANQRDESGL